jgi:hypothetical protein
MKIEAATSYGINLPMKQSQLRCEYYRDMIFMMDSLARLGTELKSYPCKSIALLVYLDTSLMSMSL